MNILRGPIKYVGIVTSPEEDAVLSLPSGFTSYESITREKVEVAAEVLIAKCRWELRSRVERKKKGKVTSCLRSGSMSNWRVRKCTVR